MFRMIGFIAATFVFFVHAQTGGTTPSPNQQLIDAKDRLEAQTNLLKAETALLQAKIGTIPTGKEGSITLGTAAAYPIGSLERVYERLKPLATDVCTAVAGVKDADGVKVLVAPADLLAVVRYRMVDQELKLIEQDAQPPGQARQMGVASIGVVLGAVESISKLFRSDLTIFSQTTTIDPRYLQDLVAGCLKDVSYPALKAQEALLVPTKSAVVTRVINLVGQRPKLRGDHATAVANKDTARAALLEGVLTRLDKLVTALIAIPEGQRQPPLVDVLLGEAVATAIGKDAQALVLAVNLADQGGMSMLEKRSFFSDRLYVGGGAIATYRITKGDRLLASGMVAQVDPEMKRVYLK
jgi:hypothetical protein